MSILEQMAPPNLKPLVWVGPSLRDLRACPDPVQGAVGYALFVAQAGSRHPSAKPLKGFGGAGVLEVIEDHDGSTYRAVYTVRFSDAVYVLHVFQKKSKRGAATPKHELALIRARLREAETLHAASQEQEEGNG
jgi:phage-related protein